MWKGDETEGNKRGVGHQIPLSRTCSKRVWKGLGRKQFIGQVDKGVCLLTLIYQWYVFVLVEFRFARQ